MKDASLKYFSTAGSFDMVLVEYADIVKAFKTIVLMEEMRLQDLKDKEEKLEKAKKALQEQMDEVKHG